MESLLSKRVDALIVSTSHSAVAEHSHSARAAGALIALWERRVAGLDVPGSRQTWQAPDALNVICAVSATFRVGYVSTFPHPEPYVLGDKAGSSVIAERFHFQSHPGIARKPANTASRHARKLSQAATLAWGA